MSPVRKLSSHVTIDTILVVVEGGVPRSLAYLRGTVRGGLVTRFF